MLEDLVPYGCVPLGSVADRQQVTRAAHHRLDDAEPEQGESPSNERRRTVVEDATVDPLFHHQRSGHGRRLPGEAGEDRADDTGTLPADGGAEEAPRSLAAGTFHRGKATVASWTPRSSTVSRARR